MQNNHWPDSKQFWRDKRVIVSGGAGFLGSFVVEKLAERGAAGLVIVGRNRDRGEAVAEDLSAEGCRTVFVAAELGEVDQCRRVIEVAEHEFGAVHALANVAASTDRGTVWDTTPALWDQLMAVNLRAPFFLLQGAADLMQRTGVAGSIVTVGSGAGEGGA